MKNQANKNGKYCLHDVQMYINFANSHNKSQIFKLLELLEFHFLSDFGSVDITLPILYKDTILEQVLCFNLIP